jgi:acetyl-CoA synthetase
MLAHPPTPLPLRPPDPHTPHTPCRAIPQLSVNALDRHVAAGFGGAPAVTFEADDGTSATYTFAEVLENVCATARVLEAHGVKRGDTVSIVLPMIPQLLFTLLACARMGAVHSAIFAGFSAEAIAERITNAKSAVVVTADAGVRGGRAVPLKATVDVAVNAAAARGHTVRRVLVTHRAGEGAKEGVPGWVPGASGAARGARERNRRGAGALSILQHNFALAISPPSPPPPPPPPP